MPQPIAALHHAVLAADTADRAFQVKRGRWSFTMIAALLVLATAAWWLTWLQTRALTMGRMQGTGLTCDVLFMSMWVTMVVAMMFPTIAPVVLAHRAVAALHGSGLTSTLALVGGYLAIWSIAGLVPMLVVQFSHSLASTLPPNLVAVSGGLIMVAAGLFQFTVWKDNCLNRCRHPVEFIAGHDFASGSRGSFRAGLSYGVFCLGCCWALMTVLVLIGMTDLAWMAAFSGIVVAEKNWRYGLQVRWVVGVILAVYGIFICVHAVALALLSAGLLNRG